MKAELEAAGYEVDLQYASNDVQTQVSQVENMISNGCELLVIASIDGSSLGEPLGQAKEAGIPVISYDRLLMNSDAVTYYATFDNYMVGQKQGEYLVEALGLEETTDRSTSRCSPATRLTITATSSSAEPWTCFSHTLTAESWL